MKGTIEKLKEECKGIPSKWARKFPSHGDDFHAESTVGIMIAVNKYGEGVDVEVVRTIVGRRCQDYISHIPIIRIPPTTGRRLKKKDLDTMVQTCEYFEDNQPTRCRVDESDTVDTVCMKPVERDVLLLRLDGLTYQEIADRLGYHVSYVGKIILKIRRRFNDTKCIC